MYYALVMRAFHIHNCYVGRLSSSIAYNDHPAEPNGLRLWEDTMGRVAGESGFLDTVLIARRTRLHNIPR